MIRKFRPRQVAYAVLSTAAMTAWRMAQDARERRRLLRRGKIRELESRWFRVGTLRIHARCCDAAGRGRVPVVLVHGWGISGSYFVPTAERLAAGFTVYAPDLPGHGLSDTPPRPLDVAGLARALMDWMDAAGIERAALVGQSMGCQVAVDAAIRCPQRVERLVLIGPTPDPAARSVARQGLRFLLGGIHERPSLNLHLARDYLRMGQRLVPEFRAMLTDPMERKLPQVKVPALLVRGEHDPMVSPRWFDTAARLLGGAPTAVIPGGGHAVQYSAPAQLTAAIQPFLGG